MYRTISFIFYLLFSLSVSAHEFYFAFAEVEFDELSGRVEATLSVTTHDLEKALSQNGISNKKLSGNEKDSLLLTQLQSVVNNGLFLTVGKSVIDWQLEAYEVQLNGITHFYISGKTSVFDEDISLRFDLLMKEFPEQQNKATLIYRGKKGTYVFLPGRKEQSLSLKDLK